MNQHDKGILRGLAAEVAEIAELPVHREKAELWRRLNDLEPVRPMVWITETPWHEMEDGSGELTLRCTDPWARGQEWQLRVALYEWRHLRVDRIISDYLPCPRAIHNTGYGLGVDMDCVTTDPSSDIISRRFHPQIREPEDIDKIRMPEVRHDEAATEANYARMCEVYDGIMPVRLEGVRHIWFTPWDHLVQWWGVEQVMMDLVLRPEMVHAAVERCVASSLAGLDQLEAQGLLSDGCDNMRVGSGAYGYTRALPAPGRDPGRVRARDMWGCSNAQIFSTVSPEMHWEFAVKHELPWFERWGLNYYGCCEPLDTKIDVLRRIPRLRKVSISPWADVSRAAEGIGRDYVISYKPNPAVVADAAWRPEMVREQLRDAIRRMAACPLEIVLKDISTVRHEPRRLWDWARIVMEVVEEVSCEARA